MLRKILIAVIGSIVALTGCTTANKQKTPMHIIRDKLYYGKHLTREEVADYYKLYADYYDSSFSRANNLGSIFATRTYPDSALPKSESSKSKSRDGSFILDSTMMATAVHTAGTGPFLPGTTNWGVAAGLGLAWGLLHTTLTSFPEEGTVNGYVSTKDTKTVKEARNLVMKQTIEAFEKAISDVYPGSQIIRDFDDPDDRIYEMVLKIVDEKIGCPNSSCAMSMTGLFGPLQSEPVMTSKFFGNPFEAWALLADNISIRMSSPKKEITNESGKKEKVEVINWALVFQATAKYLPPYIFVKHPLRNVGDNSAIAPFIVEKDRVNFFITPTQGQP